MTETATEPPEGQTSRYRGVSRFQNRATRFSDPSFMCPKLPKQAVAAKHYIYLSCIQKAFTHYVAYEYWCLAGNPTQRERLAINAITNSLPVISCSAACEAQESRDRIYYSMDRSTHLNHDSGGYRGNPVNQSSNMTDSEQTNEYDCENNSPSTSNPQNQPTYADGYAKIPPNESRRSKLQRIAQEEEENLRRWKEENRPGPIQLAPERLGGAVSLAEVRQRQQDESRHSKLKKKLRKEEMDKKTRQAEEEENEKMKAMQREKANKLEMRKKQDDEQRQKLYQHDKHKKTEGFLQRIERSSTTVSMAAGNSIPASSWAEILEEQQKQQEEDRKRWTGADHRRVNMAFLDRMEASNSGRVPKPVTQTPESSNICLDDDDDDDKPQDTALSTVPNPSQVHTDSAEEDDHDHMWTLIKLQNRFPYYERDMLEEIVKQCNGNYQQAYELLDV
ncbi:ABC transporter F family member 4-like isoform X3 [Sinocyclocheilus grahami]|uniref:ABC transporter F family member 4-like isoform X3 n=1 Tax=Sinocyclocheilus grahami TaxID=75366 RepID=UPI0007AD422C|nr:PREDICTED: ABC transporter F family member 4-like isoform X3 [Sinocyclocheilus grahami]